MTKLTQVKTKEEDGRTYIYDPNLEEWIDITPSEKLKKLLEIEVNPLR